MAPYLKNVQFGGFPGGPEVKESALQCRGHGFYPWSGKQEPTCCRAIKPECHSLEDPCDTRGPQHSPINFFLM